MEEGASDVTAVGNRRLKLNFKVARDEGRVERVDRKNSRRVVIGKLAWHGRVGDILELKRPGVRAGLIRARGVEDVAVEDFPHGVIQVLCDGSEVTHVLS